MLIDNDNNFQKILQTPWKGQFLFHFYLQRLVRYGKHIFARLTDNVAFYLDITVYILYLTKMPSEVSHMATVTWKEPFSSGFTVRGFPTSE